MYVLLQSFHGLRRLRFSVRQLLRFALVSIVLTRENTSCLSSKYPVRMIDPTPRDSTALDRLIATPDEKTIEAVRKRTGDFTVLGAGGKMGFHLCLMLQRALTALGRKDRVQAVSRFKTVRARDEFESIGCQAVTADLSCPHELERLPNSENVFFLAGVKFGTSHDTALLEKMNVAMPRLVARRYQHATIVAFSTGCVYSFVSPRTGGSTEEDATDPPGEYANSCKGREQAFVDAGLEFGTKTALIRLNYSIDLRYGVLVDLAQKVLDGKTVDLTTGYVNVIWQGDALRHAIRCLDYATAEPPFIINITGPEVLRVRDLADAFGRRFARDVRFSGKEAPTAWLNNASKSHALFGKPEVGIEQMIDWVATWLQNKGELLGRPTHFELRDGNY